MWTARTLLVGVLLFSRYAAGQACLLVPRTLPDDLRSSLRERFTQFQAAQASGHWGEVSELLGRCRFGCQKGNVYSDSYKQCLVSRMREVPMLDFDPSEHGPSISICTTTLKETPAEGTVPRFEAEELSWYLLGTARFHSASEDWIQETKVIAYRDKGQWYFTPPQWDMQDKWEKVHYTEADFARDYGDEIEVRNNPSSPVEITDVHADMDRRYPSNRNLRFGLRNLTSKKIVGVGVKITETTNGPGEEDIQGPFGIEPNGRTSVQEGSTGYGDFCDGIPKSAMVVVRVDFADGSRWELKESDKSEPTP